MRFVLLAILTLAVGGCDLVSPASPLAGSWRLASGDAAVGATITFAADGTFSARPVCNSVSGNYDARGGQVEIDATVTTFMLCDGPSETVFLDALESATRYGIADGVLTLTGPDVQLRFQVASR